MSNKRCDNCGDDGGYLEIHKECGLWFCLACLDKYYDQCPHCTYAKPKEWTEL